MQASSEGPQQGGSGSGMRRVAPVTKDMDDGMVSVSMARSRLFVAMRPPMSATDTPLRMMCDVHITMISLSNILSQTRHDLSITESVYSDDFMEVRSKAE